MSEKYDSASKELKGLKDAAQERLETNQEVIVVLFISSGSVMTVLVFDCLTDCDSNRQRDQ